MVHCIQLDTKRKWHKSIPFLWIICHSQQMLMSFMCPPWAIRLFSHYLSSQRCLECSFCCRWPTPKKRPWYAVASKIDSPSNIFCIFTTHHSNEDPHARPVTCRLDLGGEAVRPVLAVAHVPPIPYNKKSIFLPMCHLTKPPSTDRHAEPEPLLARADMSPSSSNNLWAKIKSSLEYCLSYLAKAATRQANPAAELAKPAAVGKLFSEQIWTWKIWRFIWGHPF